jgi:hypothetical protein
VASVDADEAAATAAHLKAHQAMEARVDLHRQRSAAGDSGWRVSRQVAVSVAEQPSLALDALPFGAGREDANRSQLRRM